MCTKDEWRLSTVESEFCIAQASPPPVVTSRIHNDWRLPPACEHLGHTAPNRSQSTACKQTWGGDTDEKSGISTLSRKLNGNQTSCVECFWGLNWDRKVQSGPVPGHSLSDGIDGKLLPHTAIGPCTPWHGVIFQPPPSFIKISPRWSIFIQEAIVLEFLERKVFLEARH